MLKVASFSQLTSKPLDLPTAERLLHDVLMEQAQNILTMETIQKRVADHFQIRHSDMTSKRRPNNIAIPRQIAMYLCKSLTHASLPEIGRSFGGKHHSTVIHSIKKVEELRRKDRSSSKVSPRAVCLVTREVPAGRISSSFSLKATEPLGFARRLKGR